MRLMTCLFYVILLCGCSKHDVLNRFSTPEDQATTKDYLTDLREHKFDVIAANVDPSISTSSLITTLERMARLLPAGDPNSITLVGAHIYNCSGTVSVNTVLEYNIANKWFLVSVTTL